MVHAASRLDAVLVIEDGTILRGTGFGARGTAFGELVFNTGMTGYQESLTDPSYAGQVLMFTYPMIGNYGINPHDLESRQVWPRAVVVREHCEVPSHRDATMNLDTFLKQQGIPGISGIDTRALTVRTRERGCLRCFVSNEDPSEEQVRAFVKEARERAYPSDDNMVAEVSVKTPLLWPAGELPPILDEKAAETTWAAAKEACRAAKVHGTRSVVLYDFGVKWNIVRNLTRRGFMVVQVPWDTPADDVLALEPDSLFLSNGPGDPAHPAILRHPVPALQELVHKLPTWGICFGHQLLAHAFGGSTFKLPYGHRGANQPVRRTDSHDVIVTSQNHGYAVAEGFDDPDVMVTEVNNNDGTVEALAHRRLPVRSCQYHPEASPGPKDASPLFDSFVTLVTTRKPQAETRHILAKTPTE